MTQPLSKIEPEKVIGVQARVTCEKCGHSWEGTIPVLPGNVMPALNCPSCKEPSGFVSQPNIESPVDKNKYDCKCGNDTFNVLSDGLKCTECGTVSNPILIYEATIFEYMKQGMDKQAKGMIKPS